MTLSKTNEQAFEWLIERALVGSTKEEREAAGLTDVDAQQPDAQQYYWGLPGCGYAQALVVPRNHPERGAGEIYWL